MALTFFKTAIFSILILQELNLEGIRGTEARGGLAGWPYHYETQSQD